MKLPLLLFFSVLLMASLCYADQYGLDPAAGTDTVYFRSTARLEFIEGKTTSIIGGFTYGTADDSSEAAGNEGFIGRIRVDLRTLRTGIETRDGHMRDRHLHTDEFPYAYFVLSSAGDLPENFEPGVKYTATGAGRFYIHGVWREIPIEMEVTVETASAENKSLFVRSKFSLFLDDFDIPRPKALFLKLAKQIDVEVIFKAFNGLSSRSVILPDWPERR